MCNLSRKSASKMLQRIASGELSRALLVWVPLMPDGIEPEVVALWLEIARQEPNAQRRMDYANLARVFAERAGCLPVWAVALEGWEMWKSTVIESWRSEGRKEVTQIRELKTLLWGLELDEGIRFVAEIPMDMKRGHSFSSQNVMTSSA